MIQEIKITGEKKDREHTGKSIRQENRQPGLQISYLVDGKMIGMEID